MDIKLLSARINGRPNRLHDKNHKLYFSGFVEEKEMRWGCFGIVRKVNSPENKNYKTLTMKGTRRLSLGLCLALFIFGNTLAKMLIFVRI
jgi:hypothetical protein